MLTKDVVIIGAGIGGLTAGAYLAKAGVSVLIVERSPKPGGYCGSFTREGFRFDDAVHYINNMGPGGVLHQICNDIGLMRKLKVIRIDPSDHLEMPDLHFSVYNDVHRTVSELQEVFHKERMQIAKFFDLVYKFNFSELYPRYSKKTFQDVLDEFFKSIQLKTALGIFGATLGLLPNELSALAALAYYKGSILDGGYHAVGGAQAFADALASQVKEYGGDIEFGRSVKKIIVTSSGVEGVEIENGERIRSTAVISNCDVSQTFISLLDQRFVDPAFRQRILALRPSLSNFIVYLGIHGTLPERIPRCCNLWYFPFDDYQETSVDITVDERKKGFLHMSFPSLHDHTMAPPNHENIMLFVGASFKDASYWEYNKEKLMEVLIGRATHVIPDLKSRIVVKFPATPHTLLKYTLNQKGAYRGWAPTPDQTRLGLVPQKTEINGLFLAGHWITTPIGHGGVSMVALSGRNAARSALSLLKRRRFANI